MTRAEQIASAREAAFRLEEERRAQAMTNGFGGGLHPAARARTDAEMARRAKIAKGKKRKGKL